MALTYSNECLTIKCSMFEDALMGDEIGFSAKAVPEQRARLPLGYLPSPSSPLTQPLTYSTTGPSSIKC